jgi:hypothetical protein
MQAVDRVDVEAHRSPEFAAGNDNAVDAHQHECAQHLQASLGKPAAGCWDKLFFQAVLIQANIIEQV